MGPWYLFCRWIARSVLSGAYGLRFHFSGQENVPRAGGFILAANHLSNLDPAVLAIACPRSVNFMAKKELFSNRFLGALITSCGAFPVNRGTADLRAIREAFKRVKAGKGLLLFPQGGRRPIDDASDPEPGVGMLSQRMKVPIVPAFISGSEKALPPGARKIVKGTLIRVRFGAAITLDPGKDYEKDAKTIMAAIRRLRG